MVDCGLLCSAKKTLDALLDSDSICCTGVVLAELLQGVKTEKEVKLLREFIHAFEFLDAGHSTWDKAGELSFRMRIKGFRMFDLDYRFAA
jgi:predicted nucleic acid-binding protein